MVMASCSRRRGVRASCEAAVDALPAGTVVLYATQTPAQLAKAAAGQPLARKSA
jgi:hypothetical protein